MKVLIDTNVLVSAVLKDKDPEAVILFVGRQPYFEWIVSQVWDLCGGCGATRIPTATQFPIAFGLHFRYHNLMVLGFMYRRP